MYWSHYRGQFVYVIRKRIKLEPEKAIFIYVDEVLPPTAALMSSIYEEFKDEDGFLYVTYSGENVSHGRSFLHGRWVFWQFILLSDLR